MFGDWGRLCEMTHIKFSLLLAVHLYYKVPWGKLGVCLSRHVRIEVKCYYHFSFVVLIQRICIFWPYMTKGGEQDIPFLAQYDDFLSFMNGTEIP